MLEVMPGLLSLDGAVMGYKYSGALKEMLHKLKFEGESKFLQPLAEEAAFLVQAYGESGFDMVVSIPTDTARRKQRGFDIPESIFAGALAVKGAWQPQVLARIKATAPQYGLAPDKRRRYFNHRRNAGRSGKNLKAGRRQKCLRSNSVRKSGKF